MSAIATAPVKASGSAVTQVTTQVILYPRPFSVYSLSPAVKPFVRLPPRVRDIPAVNLVDPDYFRKGSGYGVVPNLRRTLAEVKAHTQLPKASKDLWVRTESGKWRFGGGPLLVKIFVTMDIRRDFAPDPSVSAPRNEQERRKAVAYGLILSHECLHVQDDLDLARKFPALVLQNPALKKLLVNDGSGRPRSLSDDEYKNLFDNTKEMCPLEVDLLNLWLTHRNRANVHDSDARYELYQKCVDTALSGGPVRWPDGGMPIR
jgi:hypothetical protein